MMVNAKINYLEYPAQDLIATKTFFTQVFNWQFTEYGPDYIAFVEKSGLHGGFYRSTLHSSSAQGAALTVFYSLEIAALEQSIVQAGGKISTPLFAFPGGVRFHFIEPSGNEFAVWSECEETTG